MSEIVQTLWTARDEHDPLTTGFYPVVTHDGTHSYRLWEDGSWWMFSCHDNEWALVPNNSLHIGHMCLGHRYCV